VVQISQRAGLAKLGHVSFDGSKVLANASKHKAMSYDRMIENEKRLQTEIRELMERAKTADTEEDLRLGAGVAEVDLPAEPKRREERLGRIQAAKVALEAEARAARAEQLREQAERARVAAEEAGDEAERQRALARAVRRDAAAAALEPTAEPSEHAPGGEQTPSESPITPRQKMRAKVASPEGRKIYRRRKCIPEPVFGQIKQAMGFRRFSMRGKKKASGEWSLICTCHNIRKLWVFGKSTAGAA
jgi:hypothetical protein